MAGRVALVTGAGRGIGRAHAIRLARAGATVIVNDLGCDPDGTGTDPGPADRTAAEIRDLGGDAHADHTDVGSWDGGAQAVATALRRHGHLDVLVNNAGIVDAHGRDDERLERVLGVNLMGPLGAMAAAITGMVDRGFGRIVNTVSEAAFDTRFGPTGPYGISKAALWSATLSEAARRDGSGVTVNAIVPRARTRLNAAWLDDGAPATHLDADRVASVVERLVSEEAADLTGRAIYVAGDTIGELRMCRRPDAGVSGRLRGS